MNIQWLEKIGLGSLLASCGVSHCDTSMTFILFHLHFPSIHSQDVFIEGNDLLGA